MACVLGLLVALAAGGLVVALVSLGGTSSPRHTPSGPPSAEARLMVASDAPVPEPVENDGPTVGAPAPTGTVSLGGVTAGLDNPRVGVNLFAPGGPQIGVLGGVGVEPSKVVDGVLVPLVNALTNGTGAVTLKTPGIGSVDQERLDVVVGGEATAKTRKCVKKSKKTGECVRWSIDGKEFDFPPLSV